MNDDFLEANQQLSSLALTEYDGMEEYSGTPPFDWAACVAALTDTQVARVAEWRGYKTGFCMQLRERGLIGLYEKLIAFPVHGADGVVVGAHYRHKDGTWRYTKGAKTAPLIIGDIATADKVFVFESQWDGFAVLDQFGDFDSSSVAVLITRGAGNGALVAGLIPPEAEVLAWPQNDAEEKRNQRTGLTPAETWLAAVAEGAGARVRSVRTPAAFKDPNDWTRAGGTADDFLAAIAASKVIAARPQPLIEFRSPSQLKRFVPPPGMVLVGDCHIVRGSVFVIGGAPGVGKSRAGVALAEAGATGFQWFGLSVHRKFKTLIIQNENGELRLSREFGDLDCDTLDPWMRICPPPPLGLNFDREDFRALVMREIADFQPDVVLIDPWNAAARDEKARDYLATFELIRSVVPAGNECPALGIVAHTRKPRADERANGRALLNLLAGSYVLGSVPRCAFIMQAASDDTEDRRVVWTCCKNNDGEMGRRSAWERSNGLFASVPDFDWDAFESQGQEQKGKITEEHLAAVFQDGARTLPRSEARDALMELTGAHRAAAYEALKADGRFGAHLSDSGGQLSWR